MALANSFVIIRVLFEGDVTILEQAHETILIKPSKPNSAEKIVIHTFRVNMLRRGDSRRIPDSVLKVNE